VLPLIARGWSHWHLLIGTSLEVHQRLLEIITAACRGSRSTWRADIHGDGERGAAVLRLPTRSPVLTPRFDGEISPFLEVFSGWYQSRKTPDHLFAGICGYRGEKCQGASGAVTRRSRLVWTTTRGLLPSYGSVRARTNGPGERTLHEDPTRMTQASRVAASLHNLIYAGSLATWGLFAHLWRYPTTSCPPRRGSLLGGSAAAVSWGHQTQETSMPWALLWVWGLCGRAA
jgi:hypothetical protein